MLRGRACETCPWEELEIPCKPGRLDRAPCVTAPFHRRLAGQFWFLGLGGDASWLDAYIRRLRAGDARAWAAVEDFCRRSFRSVCASRAWFRATVPSKCATGTGTG